MTKFTVEVLEHDSAWSWRVTDENNKTASDEVGLLQGVEASNGQAVGEVTKGLVSAFGFTFRLDAIFIPKDD